MQITLLSVLTLGPNICVELLSIYATKKQVSGVNVSWPFFHKRIAHITESARNATSLTKELNDLGFHAAFSVAKAVEIQGRPKGSNSWKIKMQAREGKVLETQLTSDASTENQDDESASALDIVVKLNEGHSLVDPVITESLVRKYAHYLEPKIPLTSTSHASISAPSLLSVLSSNSNGNDMDKVEACYTRIEHFLTALARSPRESDENLSMGSFPLIPNHNIKTFASFAIKYALAYRWIFIYFFRFAFQSSRVFLSTFIFGTLIKGLLATTLTPAYLLSLGLIIGFEMAYGLLQIYIACTFISYFMTNIL
eukprot:TRINITY_DN34701_c0_g1_i2.p1 TRINITY_DN34701_c0_g1~~TRINITY_DN34701_c0_g1_i2.p1  ORF type:complete len:311 (-),score=12.80 TRINITY_DN34701_c0_g1_i2:61-993(-)